MWVFKNLHNIFQCMYMHAHRCAPAQSYHDAHREIREQLVGVCPFLQPHRSEHLYHPQASLYVFWSTSLLCAHQLYLYWFTPTVNEHSFFYHCMIFCCMAKAQFIFLLLMGGQPFRTLIELLLFIHKCFKNIFIFWNLNIIISFFPIPSHFFLHTQTCLGHLMLSIYMWF